MNYRDHITIEPNKSSGKPCVRGLQITVYEVLEYLASDMKEAEILEKLPDLTHEDLKACIAYAAYLIKKIASLSNKELQSSLLDFFSLENEVSSALSSHQNTLTDSIPNDPRTSEDIRSEANKAKKRIFIMRTFGKYITGDYQAAPTTSKFPEKINHNPHQHNVFDEDYEDDIIASERIRRFIEGLDRLNLY